MTDDRYSGRELLLGSEWQLNLEVDRLTDARVVGAAAVAAVMTDLAVRSGVAGLAGGLLVVVVAAFLVASGRVTNPQAIALVAASVAFGAWLPIRTSPWLLPFDVLAAALLLVAGASLATRGSVLDLSLPRAVSRAVHAVVHGLAAPAFLVRTVEDGFRSPSMAPAVLRGLAVAVPVLAVLGLLLGSADPVFAGFFQWWRPETVLVHAVLLTVGAWGMTGLLRVASAGELPPLPTVRRPLGSVEATVILGSLVVLFGAFAVAQLIALFEGGRHVIETAGLTYAEYARSGFFQLLAVATITLVVLLAVNAATELSDSAVRWRVFALAEVAVALTLVIVVVAVRRLALYEDAFGLTMLRLYSLVFALWAAAVFVALGAYLAGAASNRTWFPFVAAAAGLLALLVLNVVNPEALVARHNIDHTARTGRFDPAYLAELSDDAVPALVDALPTLPPGARDAVRSAVCDGSSTDEWPFEGWAAWNYSRSAADDARDKVCSNRLQGRPPG